MYQYALVGEDFVDPSIEESAFTFNYFICANSLGEARDKFYTIFPSCNILKCKQVQECNPA